MKRSRTSTQLFAMVAAPPAEQAAFLAAHPDLYHQHSGPVRLRIHDGALSLTSLETPGLASGAQPDFSSLRRCAYTT